MSKLRIQQSRYGASAVLMTGMLVIVIGMAAFAVDLTRMQLVRSEI